jgi:hypothetical protein
VAGTLGPGVGTANWKKIQIDPAAVHGSGYTTFSSAQDHIDWDGAAALDIGINITDPFLFMAPVYNRSSAGSSDAGKVTIRANGRKR